MDQTEQKTDKKTDYNHSTGLTDLNLLIANMLIEKKSTNQIAKELGISRTAVLYHKKRLKESTALTVNEINDQRSRLRAMLKSSTGPLKYALRPRVFKESSANLRIAVDTSLAINKGLHVLSDKTEHSGEIDLIAQKREDRQTYIAGLRTFGKELPADYEIIDNDKDSGHIEAHTSAPGDVKDKAGMDLSDNNTKISDKQPSNGSEDKDAGDA
jgi:DNA-binding Lrp family transcriptional regulator